MYLAIVPGWGTPIYLVGWAVFRLAASQWRNALIGFLLAATAGQPRVVIVKFPAERAVP
jgi:hypothetical protein